MGFLIFFLLRDQLPQLKRILFNRKMVIARDVLFVGNASN